MQTILIFNIRRRLKDNLTSFIRKLFSKRIRPSFHDLEKIQKLIKSSSYKSRNNQKIFLKILNKMIKEKKASSNNTSPLESKNHL